MSDKRALGKEGEGVVKMYTVVVIEHLTNRKNGKRNVMRDKNNNTAKTDVPNIHNDYLKTRLERIANDLRVKLGYSTSEIKTWLHNVNKIRQGEIK